MKKVVFLCAVLLLSACNEDVQNRLREYPPDIAADAGKPKVLLIVADGLRGKAVQDIEPANLRKLRRRSLYTYGGLADTSLVPMTNETGWANLLTGVEWGKHGVNAGNLSDLSADYPTIFSRLKAGKKPHKSASFTSSDDLSAHLANDADLRESFAGDDANTFARALAEVVEGDADLVFVQLGNVEKVGRQYSYESSDSEYEEAVRDLDAKIGQLVDALEARPTYGREDWLVVITTNKGGEAVNTDVDNTVYGDNTRNTFTMFYSPKFAERVLARPNSQQIPFIGNAVRYTYGSPPVNAILDDAASFNFGNNQNFTITLFLKTTNPGGGWNYPIFFAKRVTGFTGAGWNFFGENRGGTAWGFNSSIGGQVFGKVINDGNWHTITIVVDRTDTKTIRGFTDGEFDAQQNANGNNLDNSAPLTIGKRPGNDAVLPDWQIANVQVYNTAFTDAEVKELAGVTHVGADHPKYNQLIGYWPGYADVNTGTLTEMTGKAGNMKLSGPYSWVGFTDVASYLKPPISYAFYRAVPNSVDIPFMIYKWMAVSTPGDWGLAGKSWTPNFLDIRE